MHFIPLLWEQGVQCSDQGNICAVVYFDGTWPCASALLRRVWGSLQQREIFLGLGFLRDEVQFKQEVSIKILSSVRTCRGKNQCWISRVHFQGGFQWWISGEDFQGGFPW